MAFLTILNLMVGVSNDAVNFLNAAIGSNATKFKNILILSGFGIIAGVAFSEGMMDITRNQIITPSFFTYKDLMIIMLSVMITNVILLDIYNTLALPTSTSISLIFGLIGASIGIQLFKSNGTSINVSESLNLFTISNYSFGILFTIVGAFLLGGLLQFIVRLFFTFKDSEQHRKYSHYFGSVVMTSIIYFILIRGLKFSIFNSSIAYKFIDNHYVYLIIINLIFWTLLFEYLKRRFNIFRFVVLAGTFSLALAFASNDLVNFIGPFVTSLESYHFYTVTGSDNLSLNFLNHSFKTPYLLLLLSGIVMFCTLFISKKLKNVISTEVNLGRQNLGYEKFESSRASRFIIKLIIYLKKALYYYIPNKYKALVKEKISEVYSEKFDSTQEVSFDLLRASVILFISIILIAFATSLKYPVSTTYITFMAAMGAALGDGAWSKVNAVNRITGVLTVITGWILTSFFALILSLVLAIIIIWGKLWVIFIICGVLLIFLFRFYTVYSKTKNIVSDDNITPAKNLNPKIAIYLKDHTANILLELSKYYYLMTECLIKSDYELCKTVNHNYKSFCENIESKYLQLNGAILNQNEISEDIKDSYLQSANLYFQAISLLNNTIQNVTGFVETDKDLSESQQSDLYLLGEEISNYLNFIIHYLKASQNIEMDQLNNNLNIINNQIDKIRRKTLKQIKKQEISTKNSLFFLQILSNSESIFVNLNKALLIDIKLQNC